MGLGRLIRASVFAAALAAQAQDFGASLRFRGNGSNDIDRVKILAESKPVNVGSNFTIEFWMKATLAENPSGPISPGGDNWINGNIIVDRDIFGSPDYGDFGISMANGRIAFGANDGSTGYTIYGSSNVADGAWHHIAAVRQTSGTLRVFVDGRLDASSASGPTGNLQYRNGRSLSEPQWTNEPFIVIAAEKHDYDPSSYPSFSGWIDELRISSAALSTNHFTSHRAPARGPLMRRPLSFRRRLRRHRRRCVRRRQRRPSQVRRHARRSRVDQRHAVRYRHRRHTRSLGTNMVHQPDVSRRRCGFRRGRVHRPRRVAGRNGASKRGIGLRRDRRTLRRDEHRDGVAGPQQPGLQHRSIHQPRGEFRQHRIGDRAYAADQRFHQCSFRRRAVLLPGGCLAAEAVFQRVGKRAPGFQPWKIRQVRTC